MPSQISGGQQQRTSLARALVAPSDVYLFDEPLSNLDAKLRLDARGFLNHLQRDMGITAVYVTHDQAEAMALATRIAVMDAGRIVQYAPPLEVYRKPATTFVANFVGNPPTNLIEADARIEGDRLHLSAPGLSMAPLAAPGPVRAAMGAGRLTVGIRPEHLSIVASRTSNSVAGALFANENMGPETLVTVERQGGARLTARIFTDDALALRGTVTLGFDPAHVLLFGPDGLRLPRENE
jgi:ABC-type sugar transport system ATPase subunit